ncbi:MAG: hypothetical protein KJO29_07915 [Bacteroidia bacterium]|nr:hypothetical protein [Bacteroidia bacterium]
MHNHMRMYLASICCNIARSHWSIPSRWMYAHLLDGDLASNSLSWQWVAGTFSSKKYYANQENINKFFHDDQKNTFLDIEYEEFGTMEVPEELLKKIEFKPETAFPESISLGEIKPSTNTLIYNYYNLDPDWHKNEDVQRILLLEPSLFKKYPVNKKCMDFAVSLSGNIHGIKIYVGEFDTILNHIGQQHLVYKEHPANNHYKGTVESRDWMFNVNGYYPSFFKYWKACQKSIQE